MSRKKYYKNVESVEKGINRLVNFFFTHEWSSGMAMPLYLHKDLASIPESNFFDACIYSRRALENYRSGNIEQAKKDLSRSYVWLCDARGLLFFYDNVNDFTLALHKKIDGCLNSNIEKIFSDECPRKTDDRAGFYNFKMTLYNRAESAF